MNRLCFGTYAKTIQKAMKAPNGNKDVTELLLSLITDNVDITNQRGNIFVVTDKMASELLSFKINLQKKLVAASNESIVSGAACDFFEDVVLPMLMPELIVELLSDLNTLISSDEDIPEAKKTNLLKTAQECSLEKYLSDLFLYAIKRPNQTTGVDTTANNLLLEKVDNQKNIYIGNKLSNKNEPISLSKTTTPSITITIYVDEEGKFKDENNRTRSSIISWYADANKKANVVIDNTCICLLKRGMKECKQKMTGGCFDDETEKRYLENADALRALSNNYRQNAIIFLFNDKKFFEYVNSQTSGSWVGTKTRVSGAAAYYSIVKEIINWNLKGFNKLINDEEFWGKNIEIDCWNKVFEFQTMIDREYLIYVTKEYCMGNLQYLSMFGYYVSDFNFDVVINIAVDYYLSIARFQSAQPEKFEKIREKLFDTRLMDYQIGLH